MNTTQHMLAIAAAALVAVGCSTAAEPPARPGCRDAAFPAPFAAVDPCAPEQVLTTAIRAIFDYRPAEQPDPRFAFIAAAPLLDPGLIESGREASLVWAPVTTGQWQRWRTENTTLVTTVDIERDDHPPDTETEVNRVLAVTVTPVGQASLVFAVYALTARPRAGAGWQLAGLGVRG
ncbi:hypothetical protein [Nocardia sp. NPDC057227]|uniref:hypothetical protein n=1 Tax=Nocardia sp. NPDC057227 TaxID=3346056 RepID=UPI00363BCD7F